MNRQELAAMVEGMERLKKAVLAALPGTIEGVWVRRPDGKLAHLSGKQFLALIDTEIGRAMANGSGREAG